MYSVMTLEMKSFIEENFSYFELKVFYTWQNTLFLWSSVFLVAELVKYKALKSDGLNTKGGRSVYCTQQICIKCAQMIAQVGKSLRAADRDLRILGKYYVYCILLYMTYICASVLYICIAYLSCFINNCNWTYLASIFGYGAFPIVILWCV